MSTTAGAVDVIGFLALGRLFTAYITGNVVIVATHYVTGGFSQIGQFPAVPVASATSRSRSVRHPTGRNQGQIALPNEGA